MDKQNKGYIELSNFKENLQRNTDILDIAALSVKGVENLQKLVGTCEGTCFLLHQSLYALVIIVAGVFERALLLEPPFENCFSSRHIEKNLNLSYVNQVKSEQDRIGGFPGGPHSKLVVFRLKAI